MIRWLRHARFLMLGAAASFVAAMLTAIGPSIAHSTSVLGIGDSYLIGSRENEEIFIDHVSLPSNRLSLTAQFGTSFGRFGAYYLYETSEGIEIKMVSVRCGVPFYCLRADLPMSQSVGRTGFKLPLSWGTLLSPFSVGFRLPKVIPLQVEWGGLIASTLTWMLVGESISYAAKYMKCSSLRTKCQQCDYEVGVLERCPECGKEVG